MLINSIAPKTVNKYDLHLSRIFTSWWCLDTLQLKLSRFS